MKEIKYQGNYLTLSEEVINNHVYERVSLRPGVHVMPVKNEKILLMHEYRPHEKKSRWKLVSGWVDKEHMSPLDHAKEELAEEVGMQAKNWSELYNTHFPNATINGNTYYFLCSEVSELEIKIENPDIGAEVHGYDWFDLDTIFHYLNEGKIWPDDSTLAMIWYLTNQKNKKQK
ncbi:MAG: NUDIX domain-containing protein [Candidatus Pacebacteria bacterium]|nr:NUDIX domain-containing protein [Candidatus Paceibacterota bacterium]